MRVVAEIVVLGLLVGWFLWWRTTLRSQERARVHARLRAVYSAIPVGVLEIDADHQILSCNAGFASMVGVSADQIVGRSGWEFFHETSPAPDRSSVADLVAGRRTTLSGERVLQGPHGAPVAVKTDWAVIDGDRKESARVICVLTDTVPRSTPTLSCGWPGSEPRCCGSAPRSASWRQHPMTSSSRRTPVRPDAWISRGQRGGEARGGPR